MCASLISLKCSASTYRKGRITEVAAYSILKLCEGRLVASRPLLASCCGVQLEGTFLPDFLVVVNLIIGGRIGVLLQNSCVWLLLLLQCHQLCLINHDGVISLFSPGDGHLNLDSSPHLLHHVNDLWSLGELGVLDRIETLKVLLVYHLNHLYMRVAVVVELQDLDCVAANGLVEGDLGLLLAVMEVDTLPKCQSGIGHDIVVE